MMLISLDGSILGFKGPSIKDCSLETLLRALKIFIVQFCVGCMLHVESLRGMCTTSFRIDRVSRLTIVRTPTLGGARGAAAPSALFY